MLALTGIIALMWEVMDRFHQAEVARIQDKAKAERRLDKVEMARIQDKAKAEAARIRRRSAS